MWKKALLVFSLFAFTIAITVPVDSADARPRSFSSGKKSFSNTPSKSQSNVSNSTTNKSSATSTGASTKGGMFGGGSFMKGMMIGGLAGMLFGGMFGAGAFGNMMGFLVNALALVVLFMVIRGIYEAIKRRRQPQQQDPNNNRRW